MLAFRDISRTQQFGRFRSEADIQRAFAAVLVPYLGRLFTAPYVLSIRYLASLHDTAMKYLRFFLKNS